MDLGEAKPRASTNAKIKATLFPYHFSFLSETPELLTLGENVSRPGNFLDRSEVNTPRHFRVWEGPVVSESRYFSNWSKLMLLFLLPTWAQWSLEAAVGEDGGIILCSVSLLCSSSLPRVAKGRFWDRHHWSRGERGPQGEGGRRAGMSSCVWGCQTLASRFLGLTEVEHFLPLVNASVETSSGLSHLQVP